VWERRNQLPIEAASHRTGREKEEEAAMLVTFAGHQVSGQYQPLDVWFKASKIGAGLVVGTTETSVNHQKTKVKRDDGVLDTMNGMR
jgi:hypothetical protein